MLRQRLLVTLVLLPIGIAVIALGGWLYTIFIVLIMARAAWEYSRLFAAGGGKPATSLLLIGVTVILVGRHLFGFEIDHWLLVSIVLVTMTFHLLEYEGGRDQAGTDFTFSLSGIFYLGLLGSYLVLLRGLPNGTWWLLLTLFAVWLGDTAAYLLGTAFGRHRLAPRLSPKKSWEGYFSGILFATFGTPLFFLLFRPLGLPGDTSFTLLNAAVLGFFIAVLSTLGDVGVSMFKRQMKVKDTSALLPGHGGVLDRIDSWLWAAPVGYYLVLFVFLK
jgi:phosphatidate cytidylyltransferase